MAWDCKNPFSIEAGVDLSSSQYCAVTLGSTGKLALPSAGGSAIGILYTAPISGKAGEVYGPGSGVRKARYGGSVSTLPAALKLDSSGRFVVASATDIAAGSAVAFAIDTGTTDEIHSVIFNGGVSPVALGVGFDDIVLGTTAPSALTTVTFVSTTGTKTGALAAGSWTGQPKRIIQSVAATSPIGTISGTFLTLAGAAATTLALGTAVATIADFVWTGAAWRATSAITGTGSSLS
jgi:hypothetical protein